MMGISDVRADSPIYAWEREVRLQVMDSQLKYTYICSRLQHELYRVYGDCIAVCTQCQ